jgi:hypothetical protein
MRRLSTALEDDLYELIQSRAAMNHRSMNREVIFLIEAALAAEHGDNLQIYRTLLMAQGGVSSLSPAAPS